MAKIRHIIFSVIFLLSTVCAAFAEEYALVLAGGGGKGAYQVGVWKALFDYGIAPKTTVISGTSVGGLNAALFATAPVSEVERIWLNLVSKNLTRDEALISQEGLRDVMKEVPLEKLSTMAYPKVIVTAVRSRFLLLKAVTGGTGTYAHRFILNAETDTSEIQNELLATSAFPLICQPIRLKDGYDYIDGGGDELYGGDNIPIDPVAEHFPRISNVIVVYLQSLEQMTRRIRQIDYEGINLIEIIPSIDLGDLFEGTTNFSQERIALLISRGYEDASRVLSQKGYTKVSSHWFSNAYTKE